MDSAARSRKKGLSEEYRGPNLDDGQARPVEHPLGEQVLPLLGGLRHVRQAHLGDRQLGDVDQGV